MTTFRKTLSWDTTKEEEVIPITEKVKKVLEESQIKNGTLFIYSLHTTLATMIQEAIEPNLCEDIINQLRKFVDDDGSKYKHTCANHPSGTCKLDDTNGPSHVRQLLTNQNLIIDIKDGKLVLGQWQDIALLELDGPREQRKINVKIIGD
jgi:secondary thiamine-phosphate synthase enzyme